VTTVRAVEGDITTLEVDAIVNAANPHLQHGGGVAWAISRGGGPIIQQESDRWIAEHGPLEPGDAAVTAAGDLPSRIVIHVTGPVYRRGQDNVGLLAGAVAAALTAAHQHGCSSVAVPTISSGIYGYPRDEAARVIVEAARVWTREHPSALDEVIFVGYDQLATTAFATALAL